MKKIEFKNLPDKTTPINSINLNKIQDNIEEVFEGNESMGSIVVDDITCKNILPTTANNWKQGTYDSTTGTISASTNRIILSDYLTVKNNQTYTISLNASGYVLMNGFMIAEDGTYIQAITLNNLTKGTFTTTNNCKKIMVGIKKTNDAVITPSEIETIKPQIEKGSVATKYVEHKKIGYNSIVSMGNIVVDDVVCKNLLPNNIYSQTINGVTITRGEDGSLTFNGTTTAYTKLEIVPNLELDSGTYTFYFSEEGTVSGNFFGAIRDENSGVIGKDLQIHNSITVNSFSLAEAKQVTITVALGTSATVTNFKIYPMLEKGSTATGYTPYKKFSYNSTDSMGNIVVDGIVCKNIYDSYSYPLVVNNAINGDTGDIYSSTTNWYATKEYIPVNKYVGKNIISSSDSTTICFYDSSKAFISKISKQGIIPTNAYYMRFDTHKDYVNELYIELGTTLTDYTSHKKFGYNSTDSMGEIVVDDISCKNLFDKNDAITGYRLGSDGALFADSNYFCSGFITVKPNIQYTANWAMETRECVCYYDESYNFIERNGSIKTFTTPSNCHHVRMTGLTSDINNRQLEKGSVSTDYVEHKEFGNSNLKGKCLWKNSKPTEAIAYQYGGITLSSSDYDVLEFYFYTGTDNKLMTVQKTMAGYGVVGMYINGYGGLVYGRNISYVSKTSYTINECYRYGSGATTPPAGANTFLIPAYVIGYKNSFNPIATATATALDGIE